MKRGILFLTLALACASLRASIIYVTPHGQGDGSSWGRALNDLHQALLVAESGDEIWVARGTYHTSTKDERWKAFVIPPGLSLYGGFAGTESLIAERDIAANPTLLSGEIGSSSIHDNAFTVVYTHNAGDKAIVDGFTITHGAANGSDRKYPEQVGGAGWFNLATGGQASSPVIRNCTFSLNYSREGGAMLNLATGGSTCQPILINCRFIQNKADLNGGAMLNISHNAHCSPQATNCIFDGNQATYGGGICNEARGGVVAPAIRQCLFRNNKAYIRNSGIHNIRRSGSCTPILEGNLFENNNPPAMQRPGAASSGKEAD